MKTRGFSLHYYTGTVKFSSLDRSPVRYQWSGIIKLLQFTIVRFF